MPNTTYTELKASLADWTHRADLTARIPDYIALCETDMQVRCKLVDFEADVTVVITAGAGAVPAGLVQARSVYWDGNTRLPLKYTTPEQLDIFAANSGIPSRYTLTGSQIKVAPSASGNLKLTGNFRFVPLSASNATNNILTNYPDAYLYGSLLQHYIFSGGDEGAAKYGALFSAAIDRITRDNKARKYAGSTLQVRCG